MKSSGRELAACGDLCLFPKKERKRKLLGRGFKKKKSFFLPAFTPARGAAKGGEGDPRRLSLVKAMPSLGPRPSLLEAGAPLPRAATKGSCQKKARLEKKGKRAFDAQKRPQEGRSTLRVLSLFAVDGPYRHRSLEAKSFLAFWRRGWKTAL